MEDRMALNILDSGNVALPSLWVDSGHANHFHFKCAQRFSCHCSCVCDEPELGNLEKHCYWLHSEK